MKLTLCLVVLRVAVEACDLAPFRKVELLELQLDVQASLQGEMSFIEVDLIDPCTTLLLIHPFKTFLYQLLVASKVTGFML